MWQKKWAHELNRKKISRKRLRSKIEGFIDKFDFRRSLAKAVIVDLRDFRWQFVISAQVISYYNLFADFNEWATIAAITDSRHKRFHWFHRILRILRAFWASWNYCIYRNEWSFIYCDSFNDNDTYVTQNTFSFIRVFLSTYRNTFLVSFLITI
jgi:hypothetical protein